MTQKPGAAEELDAAIEAASHPRPLPLSLGERGGRRSGRGEGGGGEGVSAETLRTIGDLRLLAEALSPRASFAQELEDDLLRGAVSMPAGNGIGSRPPRGRLSRRRVLLLPAAAVVLGAVGVSLWRSPTAQAQVERLAAFIPGLGIRGYDARGLVAPRPVSLTKNGATLTVKSVLSTGETTTVQVEVTGLAGGFDLTTRQGQPRLTLRDAAGKEYRPSGPSMTMTGAVPAKGGGSPALLHMESTFAGLDPAARSVEVALDGPAPVGSWRLSVPVVPLRQAGLPVAQAGSPPVTLHGVTVQVAGVVADSQRTALQLTAQTPPPARFVRAQAQPAGARHLVLRDDRGREYTEIPSPGRTFPDAGGHYTSDAVFPPLPSDARGVTLVVPFVTVEVAGEATVQVPVAGMPVGLQIPLAADLVVAGLPFRVTGATPIQQLGGRWLELDMDLGDWRDGRRLVLPGATFVDGKGTQMQFRTDGEVNQASMIRVPIAADTATVAVTFRNPQVAVQGPWLLPVPLPARR